MHPVFLAGIIAGMIILLMCVHKNHTHIIDDLSPLHTASIFAFLIFAWIVPYADFTLYDLNEHREDIGGYHIFLSVGIWGILTLVYFKLRMSRILSLHLGGVIFFSVFMLLTSSISLHLPGHVELIWCAFAGTFTGSLVSIPCAIIYIITRCAKRRHQRKHNSGA